MQARRKDGIIINDEFGFTIGKSLESREPYTLGTFTIRPDAVTNKVSFFRGREKELEGIMAVARLRNEDCEQHVNCPTVRDCVASLFLQRGGVSQDDSNRAGKARLGVLGLILFNP